MLKCWTKKILLHVKDQRSQVNCNKLKIRNSVGPCDYLSLSMCVLCVMRVLSKILWKTTGDLIRTWETWCRNFATSFPPYKFPNTIQCGKFALWISNAATTAVQWCWHISDWDQPVVKHSHCELGCKTLISWPTKPHSIAQTLSIAPVLCVFDLIFVSDNPLKFPSNFIVFVIY